MVSEAKLVLEGEVDPVVEVVPVPAPLVLVVPMVPVVGLVMFSSPVIESLLVDDDDAPVPLIVRPEVALFVEVPPIISLCKLVLLKVVLLVVLLFAVLDATLVIVVAGVFIDDVLSVIVLFNVVLVEVAAVDEFVEDFFQLAVVPVVKNVPVEECVGAPVPFKLVRVLVEVLGTLVVMFIFWLEVGKAVLETRDDVGELCTLLANPLYGLSSVRY